MRCLMPDLWRTHAGRHAPVDPHQGLSRYGRSGRLLPGRSRYDTVRQPHRHPCGFLTPSGSTGQGRTGSKPARQGAPASIAFPPADTMMLDPHPSGRSPHHLPGSNTLSDTQRGTYGFLAHRIEATAAGRLNPYSLAAKLRRQFRLTVWAPSWIVAGQ
jgi:hypothetical protein